MARKNRGQGDGANGGRGGGAYKGVRMRKWGKWVTEVRLPNSRHRIWLGSYQTPEEAARAYDAAVFCLRGPSASLNFPDDPPDIPSPSTLSPPQIRLAASRHARRPPPPQGQVAEPTLYFIGQPGSEFGEHDGSLGYDMTRAWQIGNIFRD